MEAVRKVEDFLWTLDNGGGGTESASEQKLSSMAFYLSARSSSLMRARVKRSSPAVTKSSFTATAPVLLAVLSRCHRRTTDGEIVRSRDSSARVRCCRPSRANCSRLNSAVKRRRPSAARQCFPSDDPPLRSPTTLPEVPCRSGVQSSCDPHREVCATRGAMSTMALRHYRWSRTSLDVVLRGSFRGTLRGQRNPVFHALSHAEAQS